MVASRLAVAALAACATAWAASQAAPSLAPPASQSSASPTQSPDSAPADQTQPESSSSKAHRKSSATSTRTIHHTRVLDESSVPPELTHAEEYIQKQNYAAAEPLLRKAVDADSTNYVAWFDLGFVENELGKLPDSIAAYRKSVAANPDVFESNLNLGLQLAKTNQPDAEHFLRAATQLKPTSHVAEGQSRAWLSLARLLEHNNPDEALAAYRQAATLQPKNPEPYVSAGLLLEKQDKFADAEQEYKTALALESSSDALTGLANIYMRGRRFPEAAECLRKLVAAHPEEGPAHLELGRVLAAEGKNDDAIAELQAGAKLDPNDPSVQRDLADLYAISGKNDLAEAAYRPLVSANLKDAELHHALGVALLRQKKFEEAQKEFLAAVTLKPDFGAAYGDLAFAASENKNYPLTLKALDARVKLLPENANTYFLRASAFDHLKNFKQAAINYHLFLKAAEGKYPEQEWQAKHRLIAIEPKK